MHIIQVLFYCKDGEFVDYKKIGKHVRYFRQIRGFSQEQLAERIDISVTHMSHIETGNTKLSLPVFVALAEALDVRTDELLYDAAPDHSSAIKELAAIIDSCTPQQARCIADIAKAAKMSFDTNL